MLLRPYALIRRGELCFGEEVEVADGVVTRIGPHTGLPEPYVLSPAFVNAHSHLEYWGMLGKIPGESYFEWIRNIVQAKKLQTENEVHHDCVQAVRENIQTGVGLIGEHSDRLGASAALAGSGLKCKLFQEAVTFFDPESAWDGINEKRKKNQAILNSEVFLAAHAPHTVDEASLRRVAASEEFLSLHVAESVEENRFFERGEGEVLDFYERFGGTRQPPMKRLAPYLRDLGLARKGVQWVHGCDLSLEDAEIMIESGVTLAHCPRSNRALNCPPAKIREFLDMGMTIGLGLDAVACSGVIDMFEEMRAALATAKNRGAPLTGEQVWDMATTMGARSLWEEGWEIEVGAPVPLIKIAIPGAETTEELIEKASPEVVSWR